MPCGCREISGLLCSSDEFAAGGVRNAVEVNSLLLLVGVITLDICNFRVLCSNPLGVRLLVFTVMGSWDMCLLCCLDEFAAGGGRTAIKKNNFLLLVRFTLF